MATGSVSSGNPSLPEVNASINTARTTLFRRLFAFAGPAYLVSVGYMDPGNWATDLEGGARFGYSLMWVLVMSNLMAILLQTLSARLGIVTKLDLAQVCREAYPRLITEALWILCEIAIAACDLAEVLGAAIGLNLLFHIPLLIGVIITTADTLLVLWLTRFGIRAIEGLIIVLIACITGCFLLEIWLVKPPLGHILSGMIPTWKPESLYVAIAILGATVMPHNLYLHSALVQTRQIGDSETEKRQACRFNFFDSIIALNGALIVNGAILVLAASVFFTRGIIVTEIQQAHVLLAPLLGTTLASVLFAIALLCSGQSSTLTGTLAGQIVMEGFLSFRMRPWLRRLITRTLAVVPAAICIYLAGDKAAFQLIILSQVILSLQLPFAVIPLIHFTNDRRRMGTFANAAWVKWLAWITAAIIVSLNFVLAWSTLADWIKNAPSWQFAPVLVFALGLCALLLWVSFEPLLPDWARPKGVKSIQLPLAIPTHIESLRYRRILVPLDHSPLDGRALAHAAALAREHTATLYLLHIEEGVTSQIYGSQSSTSEVEEGRNYFSSLAASLLAQRVAAQVIIRHGKNVTDEIVNYATDLKPDLIVMGAHGHKGLKDIVFGTTINVVRHRLAIPLLIVRDEPGARETS